MLYHFFPRKARDRDTVLGVLRSIGNRGLFLTHENREVEWEDHFGLKPRPLKINQYRFCLTAISHEEELIEHSREFGCIAIGFNVDFIVRLGGFPVFYVPSPDHASDDKDRYKGISLLYRLAETQETLEFLIDKGITSQDIDFKNVLGGIKFLANVCYPTNRLVETESQKAVQYYNQREWRLIYGVVSKKAEVLANGHHYEVKTFDSKPIIQFVERVIINAAELQKIGGSVGDVRRVMKEFGLRNDIVHIVDADKQT